MIPINIYYQNCRGLRTKRAEFFANFIGTDYSFVCLTETWLNDTHNSFNYFTNNYYVYRKDRARPDPDVDVFGGGTLIAVKKEFKVHRRFDLDYNGIECTWVEVKLSSECTLLIGNHYISQTVRPELLEQYSKFLIENIDLSMYKVLCLGDFNMTTFNWTIGVSVNENYYIQKKSEILYSLFCSLNLSQHNDVRISADDNLLDLVCSSFQDELRVCPEPELVRLDHQHPSLLITLSLPCYNLKFLPYIKKNYPKGDYLGLYRYISEYQFTESSDIDVLTGDLTHAVTNAITSFVPEKTIRPSRYPHWFSAKLIKLLKTKERFHRLLKKNSSNAYFRTSFNLYRKLSKKILQNDERNFKYKVEADLCSNPKFFWQYIKTQYKNPHQVQIVQDGQIVPQEEVPNLFAEHFKSIYCSSSGGNVYQAEQDANNSVSSSTHTALIVPPVITVADVVKAAKSLKASYVAGSDKIPSFIIKACANLIAPVLCKIFNISISTGKFPLSWKSAIVVPVPKSSNVSNVVNFRPISLLCNFSKIFEKIIISHLRFYVKQSLSPHQHGFLSGRSTMTNLASFLQFTAPHVLNQKQVDTVYFDLSKAFDVVNHEILLKKLNLKGLSPSYCNFFRDYLRHRSFRVKNGNFLSIGHSIPSGVPQGSNLGPLLFIIFFDDIKTVLTSHFEIFADDLKISRIIHEHTDALYLQNDIDTFNQWCAINGMQCNAGKTVTVSFSRKQNTYFHDYNIGGTNIIRKRVHKDLGVLMDSKINFQAHVNQILSTAKRSSALVYWISKNFRNRLTVKVLFSALVRSRLEYCCEVWNGLGVTDSNRIEQIQKNFFRRVTYYVSGRSSSYKVSLGLYDMSKLDFRRTVRDAIFIFKVVNNHIDSICFLSKVNFNVPRSNSRSRNFRHFKILFKEDYRLITLNRSMFLCNLYPTLDFASSLMVFTQEIGRVLEDRF